MPVAEKAQYPTPKGKMRVSINVPIKGMDDAKILALVKRYLALDLIYLRIGHGELSVEYQIDAPVGISETAKWFLRELEIQETAKKQYKITKTKTGFVVMMATGKKFPPWKVVKGGFKTKPEAQAYIDKITKKAKKSQKGK